MQESPELEAFADAFSEANQATGVEAMLAIYALEGTTENTKKLLKNAILYELGLDYGKSSRPYKPTSAKL